MEGREGGRKIHLERVERGRMLLFGPHTHALKPNANGGSRKGGNRKREKCFIREKRNTFLFHTGDFVNGLFFGLNKGNSLVGGGSP